MSKRFDISHIRKYINNELSPKEMFEIEKASHEDEMLLDIILGLEEEKRTQQLPFIGDKLKQQIDVRLSRKKSNRVTYLRIVGMVASLLFLFGVGYLYFSKEFVYGDKIFENRSDGFVDVKIPHIEDSIEREEPNKEIGLVLKKRDSDRIAYVEQKVENSVSDRDEEEDVFDDLNEIMGGRELDTVVVVAFGSVERRMSVVGSVATVGSKKVDEVKTVTKGVVLEKDTHMPLGMVSVTDLKTGKTVFTDSIGQFTLTSTDRKPVLNISQLGYESVVIPSESDMKIELSASESMLEEVVVGYSSRKKVRSQPSEPLVGMRVFKKYIKNEIRLSNLAKGKVVLLFDIDENGKPNDFIVQQSTSPQHEQRAIQIMEWSPLWRKGVDKKPIKITLRF